MKNFVPEIVCKLVQVDPDMRCCFDPTDGQTIIPGRLKCIICKLNPVSFNRLVRVIGAVDVEVLAEFINFKGLEGIGVAVNGSVGDHQDDGIKTGVGPEIRSFCRESVLHVKAGSGGTENRIHQRAQYAQRGFVGTDGIL